jgi:alpha-D-ribose 1-methylphosphonate 5-triphosphate synthase subunit PhnL
MLERALDPAQLAIKREQYKHNWQDLGTSGAEGDGKSIQDMIKKIEANKSSVPRGQMFIKHLSPMHNLKAAKNFDIVSLRLR